MADISQQLLELLYSPESQAQLQELKDRSKEAVDLQRAGVEENQQYIDSVTQTPQETNWAPGIATGDFLFGTNFSKTYQPPKSKEERDKEVFLLKNYLQQQKKGLSDAEIDLLKSQMASQSLPLSLLKGEGTQERFDTKLGKEIDDKVAKQYNEATKDLSDLGSKYKNLEDSLRSGSIIKINSSLSNFARLIAGEKGVLTDQDIARAMPTTLANRIGTLAVYFGDPTKPPPQKVINEMIDLVEQSKKYLKEGYKNKIENTKLEFQALPTYSGSQAVDRIHKLKMDLLEKSLNENKLTKSINKEDTSIDEKIKKLEQELGLSQ